MRAASINSFLVARHLVQIDGFHHNRQPSLDPRVISTAIKLIWLRFSQVVPDPALRPAGEKMLDGLTNDSHETTTPDVPAIHLLPLDLSLNRGSTVFENFSCKI